MKQFEKVVGYPNDRIQVQYVPGKIYGLAIYPKGEKKWICKTGTLPYLYGLSEATDFSNQRMDNINISLVETNGIDLCNDYHAAVFLRFGGKGRPIEVINDIIISKPYHKDFGIVTNNDDDKNLTNLSYIWDSCQDDNYCRIPKLDFTI